MNEETEVSQDVEIRVYKYRWVQLVIYCLFSVINMMQFLQFTIISNVITQYYNVDSFLVDITGLIFFIVNILLFLPISFLIEKYSLKVTAIVSTGLTAAGLVVKIFCADPSKMYMVFIGQILCAVGQVYILNIPSKFASAWFGPDQVSTACALAVLGTQLGAAVGSVIPPFIVHKGENKEEIGKGIYHMTLSNAVVGVIIFVLVILFFRGRPKLPPSRSQLQLLTQSEDEKPSFLQDCKVLLKNRDYLILLLVFGFSNGLWNAFGILVNKFYITYFPNGEKDIGIIALIAIVSGGCIGSVVFGFILDKTHQFKRTSFAVFACGCVAYVLTVISILMKIRIATFFTIPLFGFFIAGTLVIGFEFAIEVTYPIPESVSCSLLNAFIFLFAIIGTFAIEGVIDAVGHFYAHVVVLVILIFCTVCVLLVSGNLRRRQANLAQQESSIRSD